MRSLHLYARMLHAKAFCSRYGLYFCIILFTLYPIAPVLDDVLDATLGLPLQLERQLLGIFIFALLALALDMQIGMVGVLQLGMAAFFGLGAFMTGILTVEKYPFHLGFWGALLVVPGTLAGVGLALGAPSVSLRGDYLAMVTLAFGEVVRVVLLNLESVTDGSRGLNPLPPPWLPPIFLRGLDEAEQQRAQFLAIYYTALFAIVLSLALRRGLTSAALGRAMVAMREDMLAASALGLSAAKLRLVAFASGGGLAGLAGVLYATYLTTTAEPNTYDFNLSVMALCAVIVGGLASPAGVVLGAAVLMATDNIVTPLLAGLIERLRGDDVVSASTFMQLGNWRWMAFGLALIVMVRLRPQGLLPEQVVEHVGRQKLQEDVLLDQGAGPLA